MDHVLPGLWLTTDLSSADLPSDVQSVFVLDDDEPSLPEGAGWPADVRTDRFGHEVALTDGSDLDLYDYPTFRDLADDVVYAVKAGRTVLVGRRPDAVVTVAVVGRLRSRSYFDAVDIVDAEHDAPRSDPPDTLGGHARRYIND